MTGLLDKQLMPPSVQTAQTLIAGLGTDTIGKEAAALKHELDSLALVAKLGAWMQEGGDDVIRTVVYTAYSLGRRDARGQVDDSHTSGEQAGQS